MSKIEMVALALSIIGIAVNVIFGCLSDEWRAMHKRAVLWGRLGGLVLLGLGLYMLFLSVIPPEWNVSMIAKISIVLGAVLLVGGLIGEFTPISRAQTAQQGPAPPKAGSVSVQSNISAGSNGGGDANINAGNGYNGASGGDVHIGPGNYSAGNGGPNGNGGDLNIKAGDAK